MDDNTQDVLNQRYMELESAVLIAKARLCDAQHELGAKEATVQSCQRNLAMAEARLEGAKDFIKPVEQPATE